MNLHSFNKYNVFGQRKWFVFRVYLENEILKDCRHFVLFKKDIESLSVY